MAAEQLIQTTAEVRKYLPVSVNIDFNNIKPNLQDVENTYIKPLIGTTLYNKLLTDYDNSALDALHTSALSYVQRSMVNLAYMQYIPVGQVQINDAGIRIYSDDRAKTAFQWQIEDLIHSFRLVGFRALDQLLLFLDTNKNAITAWSEANSAFYSNKQFFINTPAAFNTYVNINNSRLTYLNLQPVMRNIETLVIEKWMGTALMAEIKNRIRSGISLSAEENEIIVFIQPAIAHLSIAKAVLELGVDMSDGNIFIYGYAANAGSNKEKKRPQDDTLHTISESHREMGMAYLERLKTHLNTYASATKFASYYNDSTVYTPPADGNPLIYKNPAGRKVIRF